jgi:hypothetical protein
LAVLKPPFDLGCNWGRGVVNRPDSALGQQASSLFFITTTMWLPPQHVLKLTETCSSACFLKAGANVR